MSISSAILKKHEICIDYNQTYEMVFDLFTPRPHFIIKFRDDDMEPTRKQKTLLDLTPIEFSSLLKFVLNFHDRLNDKNKNFILSFHTGTWSTKNGTFHANLCIDPSLYLQFVEENNFDLIDFKPNREWRIKQNDLSMKDLYIANVKNAKISARYKSEIFRKKELELIRTSNSLENKKNSYRPFARPNLELFYDVQEPIVEFFNTDLDCLSSLKRYGDLLKCMIEFGQENNILNEKNGSHICLHINDSKCFNGFIRTSGDVFVQINPSPGLFYSNFAKLNDYLVET